MGVDTETDRQSQNDFGFDFWEPVSMGVLSAAAVQSLQDTDHNFHHLLKGKVQ
jgi:hypothetical protein